jgi:regulator of protease activity HflC (stomatin/prohibitin superfamily)
MLNKIIVILTFIIFIGSISIISVDSREVAILTNSINKQQRLINQGIHFIIPGIEHPNYIYLNYQISAINLNLKIESSTANVTVLVKWQINNPTLYYNHLDGSIQNTQDKMLFAPVNNIVHQHLLLTNMFTFNQLDNLLLTPLNLNNSGIVITNINIVSVQYIDNDQVTLNTISNNNAVNNNVAESIYNQAQKIRSDTEIKQAEMLQQLSFKDYTFYNYFRKLLVYRNSVTSKQELPPLNTLYKK